MAATESKMVRAFKTARLVSTPLISITTADPGAAMDQIAAAVKPDEGVVIWDCVGGLRPHSSARAPDVAARAAIKLNGPQSCNPPEMLVHAESELPDSA